MCMNIHFDSVGVCACMRVFDSIHVHIVYVYE